MDNFLALVLLMLSSSFVMTSISATIDFENELNNMSYESMDQLVSEVMERLENGIKAMKIDNSLNLTLWECKHLLEGRKESLKEATQLKNEIQILTKKLDEFSIDQISTSSQLLEVIIKYRNHQSKYEKFEKRRELFFHQRGQIVKKIQEKLSEMGKLSAESTKLLETFSRNFTGEEFIKLMQKEVVSGRIFNKLFTNGPEINVREGINPVVFKNETLSETFLKVADIMLENLKEMKLIYTKLNDLDYFQLEDETPELEHEEIQAELKKLGNILQNVLELFFSSCNVFGSIGILDFVHNNAKQLGQLLDSFTAEINDFGDHDVKALQEITAALQFYAEKYAIFANNLIQKQKHIMYSSLKDEL